MTLLRRRLFVDQDLEDTPSVAIINLAAAPMYWPGKDGKGEDPVSKRVWLSAEKPDWTTIVGVIADARTESLADAGIPQVYLDPGNFQSSLRDFRLSDLYPGLRPWAKFNRPCGTESLTL